MRCLTEPSPTFLTHTLAITEARVIIHEAARASSGHLTLIRTEPACWRSWTLVSGTRRWLKPDLEAVTTTPDGDEDHWLLEIDLGTENWSEWFFSDSGGPVFWWRDRVGLCRERGARMSSGCGLCVRSRVKGPDDRVGGCLSVVCRPRGVVGWVGRYRRDHSAAQG